MLKFRVNGNVRSMHPNWVRYSLLRPGQTEAQVDENLRLLASPFGHFITNTILQRAQ